MNFCGQRNVGETQTDLDKESLNISNVCYNIII